MRCFFTYLTVILSFSITVASCQCVKIVLPPHNFENISDGGHSVDIRAIDKEGPDQKRREILVDSVPDDIGVKDINPEKTSQGLLPNCSGQSAPISRKIIFHRGDIRAVVGGRDFVITSSYDGSIRRWNLLKDGHVSTSPIPFKNTEPMGKVLSLSLSSDQKMLLSGTELGYRTWYVSDGFGNTGGGGGTHTYKYWTTSVAYLPVKQGPGGPIYWGVRNSYDPPNKTNVETPVADHTSGFYLLGHINSPKVQKKLIRTIAVHPNGKSIATGSTNMSIVLWDASVFRDGNHDAIGKEIGRLVSSQQGELHSIAYSPDGKYLIAASSHVNMVLWDVEKQAPLRYLVGHKGPAYSAAFSPDGKTLVSASADKSIRVWDVETGKVKKILVGHTGKVYSVAFFHNGQGIISGSGDKSARLWYCWQ